jgi:hypothetical protein
MRVDLGAVEIDQEFHDFVVTDRLAKRLANTRGNALDPEARDADATADDRATVLWVLYLLDGE